MMKPKNRLIQLGEKPHLDLGDRITGYRRHAVKTVCPH